jgi:hypothetical protein
MAQQSVNRRAIERTPRVSFFFCRQTAALISYVIENQIQNNRIGKGKMLTN